MVVAGCTIGRRLIFLLAVKSNTVADTSCLVNTSFADHHAELFGAALLKNTTLKVVDVSNTAMVRIATVTELGFYGYLTRKEMIVWGLSVRQLTVDVLMIALARPAQACATC